MKKVLLISLVVVILGLLAVIFCDSSDGKETSQDDTSSVTESVTESKTEATSAHSTERTSETTPKVTTAPATKKDKETDKPETKSTTEATTTKSETKSGRDYVLNTHTMKFHYPKCSSVEDIKPENRVDYKGDYSDIISQGYKPCKRCNPK